MLLLLGTLVSLAVLRWYIKATRGKCTSNKNLAGKVAIVTGCTSGIGVETARDFAKRGARVLMACRTLPYANIVRDDIRKQTGNMDVEVRRVDLSSQQSIRDFCARIIKEEDRLDILVHNAGTAESFYRKKSPDGFELTMATNMYGPFLMTHLLMDLMKKSGPSRIVVVASSWYRLAMQSMENGGNHIKSIPCFMYYLSKYANIMFTIELAKRIQGTGVTVNSLHPGLVYTGIWRAIPFPVNILLNCIMKLFFKDSVEGAQTTIHCAVAEELEGVNGKYFVDCKEGVLTEGVQDPVKCKKFWEDCEKMLLIKPDDPRL